MVSDVSKKLARIGSRVLRSLYFKNVSFHTRKLGKSWRTIESFSCRSSSFLLALVLSFFASSARLTESVSFRSLACSLCSISCRFLACASRQVSRPIKSRYPIQAHSFTRVALFIFVLGLIQGSDEYSEHAFPAFALTAAQRCGKVEAWPFPGFTSYVRGLSWRCRYLDLRFILGDAGRYR